MAASGTLTTIRRVLALKRRALRTLQAELGQSARRIGELDRQRQALDNARAGLFVAGGRHWTLDVLHLTDADRDWRQWQRHWCAAELERDRLEDAVARMHAEIRSLDIYAGRIAAETR
jgi:hypothetical protein